MTSCFKKIDEQDKQIKIKYMDAVRNSAVNAALEQVNKYGLQMFYTAGLNNVYYADDIDCFVVMEKRIGKYRKGNAVLPAIVTCVNPALENLYHYYNINKTQYKNYTKDSETDVRGTIVCFAENGGQHDGF